MTRKGIILAGGKGTRLWPLTKYINKHLLNIYDKPLIYYPLSTLMLSGIRDILLISSKTDIELFKNLLGSGEKLGIKITYKIQNKPNGIAEAFIIGKKFIGNDPCCLILGDNFFYGSNFSEILFESNGSKENNIFLFYSNEPNNYAVCKFDNKNKLIDIKEKPKKFISNWIVTGLYFFNNDVIKYAQKLKPSKRNELEITDITRIYLKMKKLKFTKLNRGFMWMDNGTHRNLNETSNFVKSIQEKQYTIIGCLEEVAYRMNFISKSNLLKSIKKIPNSNIKKYIKSIINE